jgi:hypothetical protein
MQVPVKFATGLVLTAFISLALPQVFAQDTDPAESTASQHPLTFPRTISDVEGTVVVHTPQIDAWPNFESIEARVAIEVTPAGEEEAVYGVAAFTADTDPNLELRVVAIENTTITATSFPDSDDARSAQLDGLLRAIVEPKTQFVPLDVILSYIAPDATVPDTPGLSFDPPPIFYSSTPALLVITDGEPLLAPIPDTDLEYAVNTNWDLFRYKEKEWYLRHEDRWLKNKDLSGEWKFDNRLPSQFKKLPDDGNWSEVKAAIPPEKRDEEEPTIYISDRPAELIVTEGSPQHRTIGAAGLEYVDDTESDVFRFELEYYYLVSGRWFTASLLRGPWEHVKKLPEVFATIPEDHEKSHVLAAVPHTDEARLAMLEAVLPRKATISRDAGKDVSVFYQGDEPQFEAIPGTDVERVVNSPNDILKFENTYYLCDNAVWYVSMSADGPWVVADNIPAAIYSIPPSSPSYHVTHVHVYEDESDESSVSTGYTSGYFGVSVGFGVAMYGTGWYYPPYYGYPGYGYPFYYPYPYSYGASAWYNPNTGMYGRSRSVYGPYGGYGRGASYNPQTGAYARGAAVWDNNEIAASAVGYNPRTGTGVATNRYANESGGWGESLVTNNDKWLATQSEWDADSRTTEFKTSEGGSGTIERQDHGDYVTGSGEFQRGDQSLDTKSIRGEQGTLVGFESGSGETGVVGRTEEGDLYAGKDGQVYKRDEDGWQQRGEDGWTPVEVPDERAAQIDQARADAGDRRESASQNTNRDFQSADRQASTQRTQQAQSAYGSRDFSQAYGSGGGFSAGTYDGSRNRGTYDANRHQDLNRSYNARTTGYQNYNNRQRSYGGGYSGGRQVRRRR